MKVPISTAVRNYANLLGSRIIFQLAAGVVCGVSLFVLELAFAYLLQALLARMGALSFSDLKLFGLTVHARAAFVIPLIATVGLLKAGFGMLQFYFEGAVAEEFRWRHRSRVLHWAFHNQAASAAEVNLVFNECISVASSAVQALQQCSVSLTVCLLFTAVLLKMSLAITLPVFLLIALLLFPARALHRKIRSIGKSALAEWGDTNAQLQMSLKNVILLHIYGTQEAELVKAESSLVKYRTSMLRYYGQGGLVTAITQTAGVGLMCALAVALFRYGQEMPIGFKLSYLYLFYRFVQSSNQLGRQLSTIAVHWHGLDELLAWSKRAQSAKQVSAAPTKEKTASAEELGYKSPVGWNLKQVTFSYPGSTRMIVNELDLTVEPGRITAITGQSGAGKSTLLGILLGAVVPNSGVVDIVVDERRERLQDCRASLLRSIGYVGSESYLIEGTIRENLLYGLNQSPDEDTLASVLCRAQCDFIKRLPGGLEHVLTYQGQGLSSGEKQRLSLARALLRGPKTLVLDEATSNLDFDTERKLIEIFQTLRGEVTIVAATHRTALAEIADHCVSLN